MIGNKKKTIGDYVINVIMALICFACLYPVWYTVIVSFNDANDALKGGIYLFPREFSVKSYQSVFSNNTLIFALLITVLKTVVGTVCSVFFTAMVGYAFSKSHIFGNKVYMIIGTITMFFGGGLVPTFIVYKTLGLYNNFLVYILPAMFNFYNMIIFMSFFRGLPAGLEESARLDGATDFRIFVQIILPLSLPVVATIALFNGVAQWNDYFTGVLYIDDQSLQPVQTHLYRIVAQAAGSKTAVATAAGVNVSGQQISSESVRLATMVVTTLPIVCVYPFLQKYFVKGMLVGSIKG